MDNKIFFFFYNLAHKSNFFDKLVVFIGHIFPYIFVLLAFLFLIFHHEVLFSENPIKAFKQKWKEILRAFFSGAAAWILAQLLKILIQTGRPFMVFDNVHPLFLASGYSFLSGHATFFMALATSIFFSHKKAGYIFMLFAVLIGIARIIAGVHFPIDILAGLALGFTIAFFMKNV